MAGKKKIFVTQPSLPDIGEYTGFLNDIWESKWLTNNGKYHEQLEETLRDFLGVPYCSLVSNGTLALLIALQALRIRGEVITTPFSFVATTNSLHWNGIRPVFCDITPDTYNIDPKRIESLITNDTTAVLPVHVYGNPCDVDEISSIARSSGIKILYDAAHAFNVKLNNTSVLNFGDASILSFHATKVFTTVEGGAIITHDFELKKRVDYLRNFGFTGEISVIAPGINAKMNELQAAFGLLHLRNVEEEISKRKEIALFYKKQLRNIPGLELPPEVPGVSQNYSYYPILIDAHHYGITRDELYEEFKKEEIFTRRYFYPLISHFPIYKDLISSNPLNLPVAERIANQVLCLPIYGNLEMEDLDRVLKVIMSNSN